MMQKHITTPDSLSEKYLTIRQAAIYLKCSSVFLYQRRKAGDIKSVTVGTKKILILKESLDAFLQKNEQPVSYG